MTRVPQAYRNRADIAADSIRCDESGIVWSSAGWVGDGYDGVFVFAPEGERIGPIRLPEIERLLRRGEAQPFFMMASQSLYSAFVETTGAHIT